MSEITPRVKGRASNYKLDRGGMPAEFGPFTGVVMSTVDPTRSGRLRVYIEAFADGGPANEDDDTNWTTVSYMRHSLDQHPCQPQVAPLTQQEPILAMKTAMACGLLHQTWASQWYAYLSMAIVAKDIILE